MQRVTIDDIIKLRPCDEYPPCRLAELADGRPYLTPAEIAELDIPADDRLWVLTRLMTPEQRDRYARRVASDVLSLWDAPEVVRRWLATGDPALVDAARAERAAWVAWATGDPARAAAMAAMAVRAAEAARAERAAWVAAWAAWAAEAAERATAGEARAAARAAYDSHLEVYISWAAEEVEK